MHVTGRDQHVEEGDYNDEIAVYAGISREGLTKWTAIRKVSVFCGERDAVERTIDEHGAPEQDHTGATQQQQGLSWRHLCFFFFPCKLTVEEG